MPVTKTRGKVAITLYIIQVGLHLCWGEEIDIILNQSVTVGADVNLIEGEYAEFKCSSSDSSAVIRWQKHDDSAFVVNGSRLTVVKVQKDHAGAYQCIVRLSTGKEAGHTVNVNVLYPPSIPIITGPYKALKTSKFNLTCHADANPAASYKWTYEEDPASAAFHIGSVATVEKLYSNDLWLHCYAQNTMFPTDGNPVTTTAHAYRQVFAQKSVSIWNLESQYTFNIGSTLDVKCEADGIPSPKYWWSRQSDNGFIRYGNRLIEENVQADFAGAYTCTAENTLQPTGAAEETTEDSKTTIIYVVDPTVPEVCQNLSCFNHKPVLAPSTCPAQAACSGNTGLIAAAVVGWIIAAAAVLVIVFLCLPCRRKSIESGSGDNVGNMHKPISAPAESNINAASVTPSERPELPVRPVLTKKGSEHIYLELRPEESKDYNNKPYDYIEPTTGDSSSGFSKTRTPPDGYEVTSNSQNSQHRYDRVQADDESGRQPNSTSPYLTASNQANPIRRQDSYENPDEKL